MSQADSIGSPESSQDTPWPDRLNPQPARMPKRRAAPADGAKPRKAQKHNLFMKAFTSANANFDRTALCRGKTAMANENKQMGEENLQTEAQGVTEMAELLEKAKSSFHFFDDANQQVHATTGSAGPAIPSGGLDVLMSDLLQKMSGRLEEYTEASELLNTTYSKEQIDTVREADQKRYEEDLAKINAAFDSEILELTESHRKELQEVRLSEHEASDELLRERKQEYEKELATQEQKYEVKYARAVRDHQTELNKAKAAEKFARAVPERMNRYRDERDQARKQGDETLQKLNQSATELGKVREDLAKAEIDKLRMENKMNTARVNFSQMIRGHRTTTRNLEVMTINAMVWEDRSIDLVVTLGMLMEQMRAVGQGKVLREDYLTKAKLRFHAVNARLCDAQNEARCILAQLAECQSISAAKEIEIGDLKSRMSAVETQLVDTTALKDQKIRQQAKEIRELGEEIDGHKEYQYQEVMANFDMTAFKDSTICELENKALLHLEKEKRQAIDHSDLISSKDQIISGLESAKADVDAHLKSRNTEFVTQSDMLSTKDKIIRDLESAKALVDISLGEQNQLIGSLRNDLSSKDKWISRLEIAKAEGDARFESKNQEVVTQIGLISSRDVDICELKRAKAMMDTLLEERSKEIENLQDHVSSKDKTLGELTRTNSEIETQLTEKIQETQRKDATISNQVARIRGLERLQAQLISDRQEGSDRLRDAQSALGNANKHARELAAELDATREGTTKEIARLSADVQNANEHAYKLAVELDTTREGTTKEIARLSADVQNANEHAYKLAVELDTTREGTTKEIARLSEDIHNANEHAHELAVELDTTREGTTKEIARLSEDIQNANGHANELAVELDTTREGTTKEIARLSEDIQNANKHAHKLAVELDTTREGTTKEIARLSEDVQNANGSAKALILDLKARDGIIEKKDLELESMAQRIAELEHTYKRREEESAAKFREVFSEKAQLKTDLANKQEALKAEQTSNAALQEKLVVALDSKAQHAVRLRGECKRKEEHLAAKLHEISSEKAGLETELVKKEGFLETEQGRNSSLQNRLELSETARMQLTVERSGIDKTVNSLTRQVSDLQRRASAGESSTLDQMAGSAGVGSRREG